MQSSSVNIPKLSELDIYEGGGLNEIKIADLKGNETAIKQLINTHNIKIKEVLNANNEIYSLRAELEFQKTSPFIAGFAAFVNIIGSFTSAIGVNNLSSPDPPQYSKLITICGFVLILGGSLATILYPYARGFFNPSKNSN